RRFQDTDGLLKLLLGQNRFTHDPYASDRVGHDKLTSAHLWTTPKRVKTLWKSSARFHTFCDNIRPTPPRRSRDTTHMHDSWRAAHRSANTYSPARRTRIAQRQRAECPRRD